MPHQDGFPPLPLTSRSANPPPVTEPDSAPKIILILTAFAAGAAFMVIELAANRILAPWFGNTLFTWTGLIGVMLIALSVGYFFGGWLADLRCNYQILAQLLALSSGAILLVPLTGTAISSSVRQADVLLGPVLASTVLFALPGCLLGSVSPYLIRLISLLSADRHIGLSTGTIGMFSTLGSVAGTFAAGFLLIPRFQINHIFLMLGGVLITLSLVVYFFLAAKNLSQIFIMIMNVLILSFALQIAPEKDATLLYDKNNFYHRIRVFQTEADAGDRMISLYLDTAFQGARYEKSSLIPSKYQRFYALGKIFCPRLEKAVFLGGGAFVMPEALLKSDPSLHIDVVEIDPALQEVGRRFFKTDEYPQLTVIADDARRYLQLHDEKYDLVFGDVYHGVRNVPPHLITVEFFRLVKARLTTGGVFIMNVIGTIHGKDSLLFKSTLRTIRSVFNQTYVFAVYPDNLAQVQNIIIVAREAEPHLSLPDLQAAEKQQFPEPLWSHYIPVDKFSLDGAFLITDGQNPLEYLIARSLGKSNCSK